MSLDTNTVLADECEVGYKIREYGRETDPFSRVKCVTKLKDGNGYPAIAITTVHWHKVFATCSMLEVFIHD